MIGARPSKASSRAFSPQGPARMAPPEGRGPSRRDKGVAEGLGLGTRFAGFATRLERAKLKALGSGQGDAPPASLAQGMSSGELPAWPL